MRPIMSVAHYLLHYTFHKTYNRVLKASQKYPNASLHELRHGINSVSSQEYRKKHPPEVEYIPEEVLPEIIEPLKIFAYRDHLVGEHEDYYGVTLYFVDTVERGYFTDVQDLFADELESYTGTLKYITSELSECLVDDRGAAEGDFTFEIGELDSGEIRYWGHWDGEELNTNIFDEFNTQKLKRILRGR